MVFAQFYTAHLLHVGDKQSITLGKQYAHMCCGVYCKLYGHHYAHLPKARHRTMERYVELSKNPDWDIFGESAIMSSNVVVAA